MSMKDWRKRSLTIGLCLIMCLCTACQSAGQSESTEDKKTESDVGNTGETEPVSEQKTEPVIEAESESVNETGTEPSDSRQIVHEIDAEAIKTIEQDLLGMWSQQGLRAGQLRFIEEELCYDWTAWYEDYNGEEVQILNSPESLSFTPKLFYDIIFCRGSEGETAEAAVNRMVSALFDQQKEKEVEEGNFRLLDYRLEEQQLISLSDGLWYLDGIASYISYEGRLIQGSMDEYMQRHPDQVKDGMVPVAGEGGPGMYSYLLMEENGIYRMQRIHGMYSINGETGDVMPVIGFESEAISANPAQDNLSYLAAHGLTGYTSKYFSIDPVEGFLFVDMGNGAAVYRHGVYCGSIGLHYYRMPEGPSAENIDQYVETEIGGARDSYEFSEKLELSPGVYCSLYQNQHEGLLFAYQGKLIDMGLFNSVEEIKEYAQMSGVAVWSEKGKSGILMKIERYLVDDEAMRQLIDAVHFTEDMFQAGADETYPEMKGAGGLNYYRPEYWTGNSRMNLDEAFLTGEIGGAIGLGYEIEAGVLNYSVPEGTIGLQIDENNWDIYAYGYYQQLVGHVTIHELDGNISPEVIVRGLVHGEYDESLLAAVDTGWSYGCTETKPLFDQEQRENIAGRTDGDISGLAEVLYSEKHIILISEDQKTVVEIELIS